MIIKEEMNWIQIWNWALNLARNSSNCRWEDLGGEVQSKKRCGATNESWQVVRSKSDWRAGSDVRFTCAPFLFRNVCVLGKPPGGSAAKNLPASEGDSDSNLGFGTSLEKEMEIHSSFLAWGISWREEPGELWSMRLTRVEHDLATKHAHTHICMCIYVYVHKCGFVCMCVWCREHLV